MVTNRLCSSILFFHPFYFFILLIFSSIHYYVSSIIIVHPCTHGKIFFRVMIYSMPCIKEYFSNIPSMLATYSKKDLVLLTYSCSPHLLMLKLPHTLNNILELFMVLWLKLKSNQHISWNHLWHTNNIWTLHGPNKSLHKGVGNPKNAQDINKVKMKVMVERVPPFSTYAITWTLNPRWFTYKAMELPNVFVVSKNPIVTWQGSHLSFKKWKISTKISTPPWDIPRSKLDM